MTDPATLIGFIIGIAGIIASFVFYIRSKEIPRPVWRAASLPLIGGYYPLLPSDVEVIYQGTKVESLSKSYIAFWNGGRKTIRGSDVVPLDPIRFTVDDPNARVLNAQIIRVTREVDQAELHFDESGAQLNFDFLDPGDGVTLEVIHTGVSRQLECSGTIRGIPRGIKRIGKPPRSRRRNENDLVPGNLRKSRKVDFALILAPFLVVAGVTAFFGIGILTIRFPQAHLPAPDSYKEYLKAYHQYVIQYQHRTVSDSFPRIAGIGFLAISASVIIFGIVTLIRSSRFATPRKLALTAEDLSDRT